MVIVVTTKKTSKRTKQKVFITRKIPREGIDILKKHFNVRFFDHNSGAIKKQQLNKEAKLADALLSSATETIDANFIKRNKHLKVIANYAVGYDNIDINEATRQRVPITNCAGLKTEAAADFTLALILAISRRVVEADKYMRAHHFKGWQSMLFLGPELTGKTLGIIGCGRIGSSVARKCHAAFGMKILYTDICQNEELEKTCNGKKVSIKTLCKKADIISLHTILCKSTHHIIGKEELKLMKKSAYLINTSRGPVINEKELLKTLQKKQIAGAALDVYEFEPKLTKGLDKLDNVILSPHIASGTMEVREQMGIIAAKNIVAVLKGKKPLNLVNKELYKK